MHSSLRVALSAVVIAAALMLTAAPASAAPTNATAASTVSSIRPAGEVSGQPWSSPSYPVHCDQRGTLISCTPSDPNQVRESNCYLDVIVNGESATICTTYEGHADAIKAAGGTPVAVDFGCSFGDVVCAAFQNWGRSASALAAMLMYLVLGNTQFTVGGSLWNAAADEWSFWAWATMIVLLASIIWAITSAVVSRERDQLVGALVRSFVAVPAVAMTFWLTGHLVQAVDGLMLYIVNRHSGFPGLFSTMQSVMWAGGQAGYVLGFVIFVLVAIGMLLLLAVFLFRNVALAALLMVGPIAWMLFPARAVGPQWVVRYISALAVLLLTGPLTISFFSLIVRGLATVHTIWDPAAWPYVVGLVLIAFAPFAVFGLFSFMGSVAVDAVGSRLGSHAAAIGTRTARTAASIPTRLGSLPAGVPAARRAPQSRPTGGGHGPAGPSGATTSPSKSTPPKASAPKPTTTSTRSAPASAPAPTTASGHPQMPRPANAPRREGGQR